MNDDALKFAYAVKEIFSGVNDSFGREISSDIIDEILVSLHKMNSVCEENDLMNEMLQTRIQQSSELASQIAGMEV